MTDIVQRAKTALEGVTVGPWELNPVQTTGYAPHYGVKAKGYFPVVHATSDVEGYGTGSTQLRLALEMAGRV